LEPATGILLLDPYSVIGVEKSTAILHILLPIQPILVQTSGRLNQDVQNVERMGRIDAATGILLPDMQSVVGVEKSNAILPILLPSNPSWFKLVGG
jgi:hypothetical protein